MAEFLRGGVPSFGLLNSLQLALASFYADCPHTIIIIVKVYMEGKNVQLELIRDFQTWLITQVSATRGAAFQFPSELLVCPGCSVYNSQAAEQVTQAT